jgi:hypothetical protein
VVHLRQHTHARSVSRQISTTHLTTESHRMASTLQRSAKSRVGKSPERLYIRQAPKTPGYTPIGTERRRIFHTIRSTERANMDSGYNPGNMGQVVRIMGHAQCRRLLKSITLRHSFSQGVIFTIHAFGTWYFCFVTILIHSLGL